MPFPKPRPSADTRYKLGFAKPIHINVTGSYVLKTATRTSGRICLDLVVTMPSSLFTEKDYLNHRYAHKRAFYLAHIAASIKRADPKLRLSYKYLNDNYLQPVILVQPNEKDRDSDFARSCCDIQILLAVSEDIFPKLKTLPGRNCVRQHDDTVGGEHEGPLPTSFYNSSVRSDQVITSFMKLMHGAGVKCAGYKDACILGRVWLRQRGFSSSAGYGGFGNFEWAAMLALMLNGGGPNDKPLLASTYDCHQLFRAMLQLLATKDFLKQPLLVHSQEYDLSDKISTPLLFDGDRAANILYKMTSSAYRSLQQEAQMSVKALGGGGPQAFDSTYILKLDEPTLKYDFAIRMPVQTLVHEHRGEESYSQLMEVQESIYDVLAQGLGDRASSIQIRLPAAEAWSITTAKPAQFDGKNVTIAIVMDIKNASRAVDRGPAPEEEEKVAKFRQFWGSKSELRRFKDGQVLESVVWTSTDPLARMEEIIGHLLASHYGTKVTSNAKFMHISMAEVSSTTTSVDGMRQLYTTLEQNIRALEGLPLEIRQIQLASPLVRKAIQTRVQTEDVVDVVVQFEGSGRWPDDLEAIQMTKTAFLLKLSELLQQKKDAAVSRIGLENETYDHFNRSFLDIKYDAAVTFRVRIHHEREQMLLERLLSDKETSAKMREERAAALAHFRRTFLDAPLHAQAIDSASTRHPAYASTMALTKRWFAAHLLTNHFAEETIEILAARTFMHPAPWQAPSTDTTGFLRTLLYLSRWDWQREPLTVDFSGTMKSSEEAAVRTRFEAWRSIDPSMNRIALFVATNLDQKGTTWTEHRPVKVVAGRMTSLAKAAYSIVARRGLDLDPATLFAPSLHEYDFALHLDTRRVYGRETKKRVSQYKNLEARAGERGVPECAQLFLEELQMLYGDAVVLFHGRGGAVIAGVWSPHTARRRWKVNLPYSTVPTPAAEAESGSDSAMEATLNKDAILAEMVRLGGDMIKSVTLKE